MSMLASEVDEEELVRSWPGGRLRVYAVRQVWKPAGRSETGAQLFEPELEWDLMQEAQATPYGGRFALLKPTAFQTEPGVWAEVEVRDGRPQVVKLWSASGGPELTHTVLRRLGPIADRVRDLAVRLTVRDGEVVGVTAVSASEARDFRSFAERTADVHEATHKAAQRRGRPAEHERVARIARDAHALRASPQAAVAAELGISVDAAKKRIRRAKAAGFETEWKEDNHG